MIDGLIMMDGMIQKKKEIVKKAGLIPVRIVKDKVQMLFMRPNDPDGVWGGQIYQIAKGHIEDTENSLNAAVREAREELGIMSTDFQHVPQLIGTKQGPGFELTVFGVIVNPKPKLQLTTFETMDVKWLDPLKFAEIGRVDQIWAVSTASKQLAKWQKLI